MNRMVRILMAGVLVLAPCSVQCQNISDARTLLSSDGKILFGSEPNTILVMDHVENIKKIEAYLAMVDTPPKQVLIEARVVEVKLTAEHALGINWSAFADKQDVATIGHLKLAALQQQIPYKATNYASSSLSEAPFTVTLFDKNINIVLQTLANNYDTNILSAPRVTTVNNRAANIEIVQRLPWAEPSVTVSDTGVPTVTWTVHFENVGILLGVTPTITDDGQIAMDLKPEVSEKISDYPLVINQGGTDYPYNIPIIDRRSANTRVVIGNGQTFIIGGLIKESTVKGESKIPLLGDIPGLGWAFKSVKNTRQKTELLIFVSPTIVTPSVVGGMERKEKEGVGKWYQPKQATSQDAQAMRTGDLQALRVDREKWGRIISLVDALENKVDCLVDKRESIERNLYNPVAVNLPR